jgi:hypothetical protein
MTNCHDYMVYVFLQVNDALDQVDGKMNYMKCLEGEEVNDLKMIGLHTTFGLTAVRIIDCMRELIIQLVDAEESCIVAILQGVIRQIITLSREGVSCHTTWANINP